VANRILNSVEVFGEWMHFRNLASLVFTSKCTAAVLTSLHHPAHKTFAYSPLKIELAYVYRHNFTHQLRIPAMETSEGTNNVYTLLNH
jgi:hypothetical protein